MPLQANWPLLIGIVLFFVVAWIVWLNWSHRHDVRDQRRRRGKTSRKRQGLEK